MKSYAIFAVAVATFFSIAVASHLDTVDLDPTDRMVKACANQCNFRLCRADGTDSLRDKGTGILLRTPRTAVDPFVCLENQSVGRVLTGEALVRNSLSGPEVPISRYEPTGLSDRFKKKHFGLYNIEFLPGKQGIGRRKSVGNQEGFLDGLCVTIPIRRYDLLRENGSKMRTVSGGLPGDCLAVQVSAPVILVELSWDTGDDIDLAVTEPSGEEISFNNLRSSTGGRLFKDDVGSCDSEKDELGKEQVRYQRDDFPSNGTYNVTISHSASCGPVTRWRLRIIVNGILKLTKRGRSRRAGRNLRTVSFDF